MILIYDDRRQRIYGIRIEEKTVRFVDSWPAGNNADSHSRGPWPEGVFPLELVSDVEGEDGALDGKFGPHFLLFRGVPGRSGMGIHAGRAAVADGRGRSGPFHATLGCIRTWAQSVREIVGRHRRGCGGEIERLVVIRDE